MKTVLIVDDDWMTVEAIAAVLEEEGILVLMAYDGEEALELVRRERPHLVLTDITMPRLDGPGLCREIKSDPAMNHTPVVLLSARSNMDPSGCGADWALSKGADLDEMLEVINRFLAGSGSAPSGRSLDTPRSSLAAVD